MTDEELITLYKNGDKSAERMLMERYKTVVRSIARHCTLGGGETEDLVQEGMIGLFKAMTTFDGKDATFSTYAHKCIKNSIIDAIKISLAKKYSALNESVPIIEENDELFSAERDPEQRLIFDEENSELKNKMNAVLSPFEYKVMQKYIEGSTLAEIAIETDRPYKAIDNAISRAKKKLQTIFKINNF